MNQSLFRRELFISILVILIGFFFAFAVLVKAETNGEEEISGITFPVAELGNCGSKAECQSYCDNPANMEACIAFAEKNGLMNKSEVARAKKFAGKLQQGAGPGGCSSPAACDRYCSNIQNIEACVTFAEQNGIDDDHVREGKKMAAYLKSGGTTPGGCTSRESCEAYCEDFSHAEECLTFAEKTGLGPASAPGRIGTGGEPGPRPEDLRRVMQLAAKGETPGGCKSKTECESYCRAPGHFEECITFAEKAGFMKPEQAQAFRRTGGKGPGGCDSKEACEAYCNAPANREACFRFAEENGLMKKEDLEQAKEGMVRLRAGIEGAPPEVVACLKSSLGPNVIEDIQAGKLVPGPQIGEQVRGCFERFGESHSPRAAFAEAPPAVLTCLKEKLGSTFADIQSGKTMPTPEMGDAMRVCFQSMQLREGRGSSQGGGMQGSSGGFVRTMPAEVVSCLKEKLGDGLSRLEASGHEALTLEQRESMKVCFESFRPDGSGAGSPGMMPGAGAPPPGMMGPPPAGVQPQAPRMAIPAEVITCLKSTVSPEAVEKLLLGSEPSPEVQQKLQACFESLRNQFPIIQQAPTQQFQAPPPADTQQPPPIFQPPTDIQPPPPDATGASGGFILEPFARFIRALLR